MSDSNKCGEKCFKDSDCTHFSWISFNGGTCWLNDRTVGKEDVYKVNDGSMIKSVCGLIVAVKWRNNTQSANNCQFVKKNNNLNTIESITRDECETVCKNEKGCTHYNWATQSVILNDNGTCWLRKGSVNERDAQVSSKSSNFTYTSCGIVRVPNTVVNNLIVVLCSVIVLIVFVVFLISSLFQLRKIKNLKVINHHFFYSSSHIYILR
jgi:hypothetical protein